MDTILAVTAWVLKAAAAIFIVWLISTLIAHKAFRDWKVEKCRKVIDSVPIRKSA